MNVCFFEIIASELILPGSVSLLLIVKQWVLVTKKYMLELVIAKH